MVNHVVGCGNPLRDVFVGKETSEKQEMCEVPCQIFCGVLI